MARRAVTVAQLALEADLDLDETVVTLWDAGIDQVETPDDVVVDGDVKRARSALGIDDPRQVRTISYWLERTQLTRSQFAAELAELDIHLGPAVRVLPKGAVRKVRRRFAHTAAPLPDPEDRDEEPIPPLVWGTVGAPREVRFLNEQDVCDIHEALVQDFAGTDDPIDPPGLRSFDLLSSAVHRPRTSLGDSNKYPTVEMAGGALLHSLVLNHAFANGNKRTGIVALLVFLDRNNFILTCQDKELFRFVLRVAQHGLVPMASDSRDDREVMEMATWIRQNARLISRGEHPMSWHKLKRILRQYDCWFEFPGGVGNRINIYRSVERKARFGRRRAQVLFTQSRYAGDGTEVTRNALTHIRQSLELDEGHGYDSKTFYESHSEPDDFIQQYRTTLRRLARL